MVRPFRQGGNTLEVLIEYECYRDLENIPMAAQPTTDTVSHPASEKTLANYPTQHLHAKLHAGAPRHIQSDLRGLKKWRKNLAIPVD
jgi:hypothetical protein